MKLALAMGKALCVMAIAALAICLLFYVIQFANRVLGEPYGYMAPTIVFAFGWLTIVFYGGFPSSGLYRPVQQNLD